MQIRIDTVLHQLSSHPYFLRLKTVIDNVEGWHDQEDVYSHSMKTLRIAKENISGKFITNPQAKKLFLQWTNNKMGNLKQKDISLIVALIHDCGKILHRKESTKEETLITKRPLYKGEFICPGHEYWGAKIVAPKLLKNIDISEKTEKYIMQVVEYHGFFSNPYFPSREKWLLEQLLSDVKSHYAGLYIEGLFNMYCDGYTAPAFVFGKEKIETLFNEPSFYTPREYFIP